MNEIKIGDKGYIKTYQYGTSPSSMTPATVVRLTKTQFIVKIDNLDREEKFRKESYMREMHRPVGASEWNKTYFVWKSEETDADNLRWLKYLARNRVNTLLSNWLEKTRKLSDKELADVASKILDEGDLAIKILAE